MTKRTGEILLLSVIFARGTSFIFNKITLRTMEPLNVIAIRFLIAAAILLILFGKRFKDTNRETIINGIIIGIGWFALIAFEMFGLRTVDTAVASLLENTAIVMIPLLNALFLRRLPDGKTFLCILIAFIGVVLLGWTDAGFGFGIGEFLMIMAALSYSLSIIYTDRKSKDNDPIILGILQVSTIGVLGLIGSFIVESPRLPETSSEWGCILVLAILCSAFGYAFQPLAQKPLTPERTALFFSLQPLYCAILGIVVLHEHLNTYGIIGAVLILAGLFIQSNKKSKE